MEQMKSCEYLCSSISCLWDQHKPFTMILTVEMSHYEREINGLKYLFAIKEHLENFDLTFILRTFVNSHFVACAIKI